MKTPLISVIIPVFNSASFLDKCMKSVCEQTLKDIEILLINDGSTDNSLEICKKWADKDNRIKFINQENKGIAETRNIGIENSSAPLIGFVDSDDWIEKDMFEVLYNILKEEDADISICGFSLDHTNGENIKKNIYKPATMNMKKAVKEIILDNKIKSYCWNKLFKKSLFDFIKFPMNRVFEDYSTLYKVFYNVERVVITERVLYHYINNPASIVNSKTIKKDLDILTADIEKFHFISNNSLFSRRDILRFEIKVKKRFIRFYRNACKYHINKKDLETREAIRNDMYKIIEEKSLNAFKKVNINHKFARLNLILLSISRLKIYLVVINS